MAGQGDPEQSARLSEHRALLLQAFDELRGEYREILVLVALEEFPVTEAAEILGIPLNTAYTHLRRAKNELAAAVDRITVGGRP